jgi:hypothetical protein
MSAPGPAPPRPSRHPWTARGVAFALFVALLALAAMFYAWWCLAFHVCVDNGLYAVVVTLAGFGLAGMWVTLPPRPRHDETPP